MKPLHKLLNEYKVIPYNKYDFKRKMIGLIDDKGKLYVDYRTYDPDSKKDSLDVMHIHMITDIVNSGEYKFTPDKQEEYEIARMKEEFVVENGWVRLGITGFNGHTLKYHQSQRIDYLILYMLM